MVQLGLKIRHAISPGGCGMSFVSYPYLILLISGQMFEVTAMLENF